MTIGATEDAAARRVIAGQRRTCIARWGTNALRHNPLRSEAEAFRFLGVVIVGAIVIVAAAYLNAWVGVAAALVVIAAVVRWVRG